MGRATESSALFWKGTPAICQNTMLSILRGDREDERVLLCPRQASVGPRSEEQRTGGGTHGG
jgi:hypothetical protein